MKKLLLGLGTLSIAILPVAALVSCGDTTPTEKTDLGITSKIVEQSIIDTAVTALDAANAMSKTSPEEITARNTAIVAALTPIFEKVSLDNVVNFTALSTAATTKATAAFITLTANDGFAFGTETTLVSKSTTDPVVDKDLGITSKIVEQSIIDTAVTALDAANAMSKTSPEEITARNTAIVAALTPIFEKVSLDNVVNFTALSTAATTKATAAFITLTANDGFAFGTETTLVSKAQA